MVKRVEAVILDWAGTTVDYGSLAPIKAVTEVFARSGVVLAPADARRDMGIYKKDHIRNILAIPKIVSEWRIKKGAPPNEADVEMLFEQFIPLQFEVLEACSGVIRGVPETVERLRSSGIKIGSTTGYTRPMLDILVSAAAKNGYRPDIALCPDDVGGGRPNPWMCLRIALEFKLSSVACAVKIGDTVSDLAEARNAGMWSVGVSDTGNELGLTQDELAALSELEREKRSKEAQARLEAAGAHYVIDRVANIEPVLEKINVRIAAGEKP